MDSYLTEEDGGYLCTIGSLILAVLGKKHHVPVHAVQTDGELSLLGDPDDVCSFNGIRVAPSGTKAYVPLVDWVDNKYITKAH